MVEDDTTGGRPKTAPTPETIAKVHDIVLDHRREEVSEKAETVGISEEKVRNILHKELGMRKLCARWVSYFLNADQKQMCIKDFRSNVWTDSIGIRLILSTTTCQK